MTYNPLRDFVFRTVLIVMLPIIIVLMIPYFAVILLAALLSIPFKRQTNEP